MRLLLGLLAVLIFAASLPSARAEEWCGFIDREHSKVRCGYSSLPECQHSLGDKKGAFCMPDPSFASRDQGAHFRLAANRF
ncbi:MAG: hypothetical protein ACREB2_05500 [Pseudolabrys sp.]